MYESNVCSQLSVMHPDINVQMTIDPTMRLRRKVELSLRVMQHQSSEGQFDDESAINDFMINMIDDGHEKGSLMGRLSSSPHDRAFETIYRAWCAAPAEKVNLAREALAIDSDCVDAYILLAEEEAVSDEERCALYQEAIRAGERQLGPDMFKSERCLFWQIVETRPYMRAKAALAETLVELGDELGAIQHYKDMLSLNDGDNQAVRHRLLNLLLLRNEESHYLTHLFERYKGDRMAHFVYNKALWLYTKHKKAEANATLRNAMVLNQYVPLYLLELAPLPEMIPQLMALGSPEEAASCASSGQRNWSSVDGALSWLRRKTRKPTAAIIASASQVKVTLPDETLMIMFDPSALMPVPLMD